MTTRDMTMTDAWTVAVADETVDPYLAAALWLLERGDGALVVDRAVTPRSVHAKVLLESVAPLASHPAPTARGTVEFGIVLIEPSPATLEGLDRRAHPASTRWMLLRSEAHSVDRAFQDAWLWAQSRPAPQPDRGRILDPAVPGIVSGEELWALALRSGVPREQLRALRTAETLRAFASA
jgi:hypothetical protein